MEITCSVHADDYRNNRDILHTLCIHIQKKMYPKIPTREGILSISKLRCTCVCVFPNSSVIVYLIPGMCIGGHTSPSILVMHPAGGMSEGMRTSRQSGRTPSGKSPHGQLTASRLELLRPHPALCDHPKRLFKVGTIPVSSSYNRNASAGFL